MNYYIKPDWWFGDWYYWTEEDCVKVDEAFYETMGGIKENF